MNLLFIFKRLNSNSNFGHFIVLKISFNYTGSSLTSRLFKITDFTLMDFRSTSHFVSQSTFTIYVPTTINSKYQQTKAKSEETFVQRYWKPASSTRHWSQTLWHWYQKNCQLLLSAVRRLVVKSRIYEQRQTIPFRLSKTEMAHFAAIIFVCIWVINTPITGNNTSH